MSEREAYRKGENGGRMGVRVDMLKPHFDATLDTHSGCESGPSARSGLTLY